MLPLLLFAAAADTGYPHRPWDQIATLNMSVADATACIARVMDKDGSVLVLPVDGGNDIDWSTDVPWGKQPDAWERFSVRQNAGVTILRISYRHPWSQKRVNKDFRKLADGCLRVTGLQPS